MRKGWLVFLVWLLALPAWAADSYLERSFRYQDWIVGPQPEPADLVEVSGAGVHQVVSLRQPGEHADLDFDEAAVLGQLDLPFALIPSGGDRYPHSPARLAAFADAIESVEGPKVLHCRSGARAASYLAAYLITRRGMTRKQAEEALAGMDVRSGIVDALLETAESQ